MIFVTLGTQDKPFTRLLKKIDDEIKNGNIDDEVVVQGGCTKIDTDRMTIFNQVSQQEFEEYIDKCDILLTHAGVGSIITGLKHSKKVVAVPRLAKYGEAANDHQIQLVENFSQEGYILGVNDLDNLSKILKDSKKFKPKKYVSNTEHFIEQLVDYIEKA